MATTTIQLSTDVVEKLKGRKMYDKESYEDVIRDLLEDTMELSEETKRQVERARAQIARGKFHTHEHVKRELGL